VETKVALIIIAATVVVALAAALVVQTERLHSTERILESTRSELAAANRSIVEMAAERAAAEARARLAIAARVEILTAPADHDGPVSIVLRRALLAADEIGDIR
jgi:hypothetical protein